MLRTSWAVSNLRLWLSSANIDMVVPKSFQLYLGGSTVFGKYGHPWDVRAGMNWFSWKNRVVRSNTEGLYLYNSPVGYSSVPFQVGGHGFVFHSNFEMAF